jgi:hypothetical protein
MLKFSITDEQQAKVEKWLREEVYPAVIADQKARTPVDDPAYEISKYCWDQGHPYGGAIGGGVSYVFTPTSIGVVVHAQEDYTSKSIDITDYDHF